MKNIFKYIPILLFAFLISCDEVKNPLKPNNGKCGDETLPVPIRKILVEDYTGHTCGNCPRAAEKIAYLQKNYCDYEKSVIL